MNALATNHTLRSHFNAPIQTFLLPFFSAVALAGCSPALEAAAPSIPVTETTPLSVTSDRAIIERLGPNKFSVKCTQVEAVAVKQREPTWCWAACAEMLLRYGGARVTQEEIADRIGKRTKEGEDPKTANQVEIWRAMNPDLMEEYHRREHAWDKTGKPNTYTIHIGLNLSKLGDVLNSSAAPSTDAIVQELSSGNPVVLGLKGTNWGAGHVVLGYGVEYSCLKTNANTKSHKLRTIFPGPSRDFVVNKLFIIDPQPDEGQSQLAEVSKDDLKAHMTFDVGKSAAREHLMAYMRVYMPTPEEMPNSGATKAKKSSSRKSHAQNQ
jgi:hypothetical protein